VTTEILDTHVTIVAMHTATEGLAMAQGHHLSEYGRRGYPCRLTVKRTV